MPHSPLLQPLAFGAPPPRAPPTLWPSSSLSRAHCAVDHGGAATRPPRGRGGRGGGSGRSGDGRHSSGNNNDNNGSNSGGGILAASPWARLRAAPAGLFRAYGAALAARPVPTKMATSGVVSLLSNLLAARLEAGGGALPGGGPPDAADAGATVERVLPFVATTVALSSPMYHAVFAALEAWRPATSLRNVLSQVVVEQTLVIPLWIVLTTPFYTAVQTAVAQGRRAVARRSASASAAGGARARAWGKDDEEDNARFATVPRRSLARFRKEFWPILKLSWCTYPAVLALNIAFVPLQWRLAVLNLADFFFAVRLSLIKNARFEQAAAK